MGTDYIAAVIIRYAVLLLAGAAARWLWVIPLEWDRMVPALILLYGMVVIQTMPSAWLARRAARPWQAWTFLNALCAHALGATAAYTTSPFTEPRYEEAHAGGMQFVKPWETGMSLVEAGMWIAVYAIASAGWAVLVGWVARAMWGAAPADSHLIRIRRDKKPRSALGAANRLNHPADAGIPPTGRD